MSVLKSSLAAEVGTLTHEAGTLRTERLSTVRLGLVQVHQMLGCEGWISWSLYLLETIF